MSLLSKIQTELKAPKNQFNSFGKYKYRSLEDIFEGLKPLLAKYECSVTVTDTLVQIGDRYYVKASASLRDKDNNCIAMNDGYARESETKKGMDDSQVTGATSSYARKYALNGLFAIDDTKDADTDAYTSKTITDNQPKTASKSSNDEKKQYWNDFTKSCRMMDIEPIEFLTEFAQIDMDKPSEVQNAVVKYLKSEDMFVEQLENYKQFKNNQ